MSILKYMTNIRQNKAQNPCFYPNTLIAQSVRIPKKHIWWVTVKTYASVNASRRNISLACRDKKASCLEVSWFFNTDLKTAFIWLYIYQKNNRIMLILSAQLRIFQSICQRCYVTCYNMLW